VEVNIPSPVQESMYRKEPRVYPRHVSGRFSRLRDAAMYGLLGLFYFLPWITVGSHQAVLFDLPARRFYILGLTFWPQDFIYLATLMISAGLSCSSSRRLPAGCGAATRARKPSGPRHS
jgi:hypothetical protein